MDNELIESLQKNIAISDMYIDALKTKIIGLEQELLKSDEHYDKLSNDFKELRQELVEHRGF